MSPDESVVPTEAEHTSLLADQLDTGESPQVSGPRVPAEADPFTNADVVNAAKPVPPAARIVTPMSAAATQRGTLMSSPLRAWEGVCRRLDRGALVQLDPTEAVKVIWKSHQAPCSEFPPGSIPIWPQ